MGYFRTINLCEHGNERNYKVRVTNNNVSTLLTDNIRKGLAYNHHMCT